MDAGRRYVPLSIVGVWRLGKHTRERRALATGGLLASLALGGPGFGALASAAGTPLTITPASGGPRTVFTVSFRSPIDLRNQGARYPLIVYDVSVRRGAACSAPGNAPRDDWKAFIPAPRVHQGATITRRLAGGSRGWCAGPHSVVVSIGRRRTTGTCRNVIGPPADCVEVRVVGRVTFTIGLQPLRSGGPR
jgi:hypothetical protein